MNQRTFVQCMAALAILTLASVIWPVGKPRSVERVDQSSASTEVTAGPGSLQARSSGPESADWPRRRWRGESRREAPRPNGARVDAAQVLAMVNQTPLQLRDLMPVRPEETEKELSPEQYHSRLQRAIEMELTFQAAGIQGVKLTAGQQQRLEQIVAEHRADLEHYQQYGLSWSSISPAQMEFEKRLLSAQMLEQNLLAKKAAVAPSPEPEMQSRYEQARRELFDQLQASANITQASPSE